MAVDDLQTEYHLTPSGWKTGTERFFGDVQGQLVEPPADRVLTLVGRIYQASGWSPESRTIREEWRSPKICKEELAALQKKFPCPFRLRLDTEDISSLFKNVK
jgi:hypothetical protein